MIHVRYGTPIHVRCGTPAAKPAAAWHGATVWPKNTIKVGTEMVDAAEASSSGDAFVAGMDVDISSEPSTDITDEWVYGFAKQILAEAPNREFLGKEAEVAGIRRQQKGPYHYPLQFKLF